jgi:hypothetical protein
MPCRPVADHDIAAMAPSAMISAAADMHSKVVDEEGGGSRGVRQVALEDGHIERQFIAVQFRRL